jgi:F-type H+-transporting ATPase subunit delta
LRSPLINLEPKTAVVTAVTKGKVTELTSAFNQLLVKKGREKDVPAIAVAFIEQYNELKGIHAVKLTTPVEVSETLKKAIETKLASERGLGIIELETAVDPKLIGGFLLEFNNNLVDASILRDLKDIRKQFLKNLFVNKI